MKNIFDALNNSGGLKAGLGNVGETLKGAFQNAGAALQGSSGGQNPLGNLGGIGGLMGSAALGGLLGALFTGKGARKVAKGALMVGGTAAAGALAWSFYQKWSQGRPAGSQTAASGSQPSVVGAGTPPAHQEQAALPPAEEAALVLLEAMVFAARADGHIDESEKGRIHEVAGALFPGRDMPALLETLMNTPIDPAALAARVRDPEEGRDLYRLSCAVVDVDNFMERSYLDGLAQALGLAPEEKTQLEKEAEAAQSAASQA